MVDCAPALSEITIRSFGLKDLPLLFTLPASMDVALHLPEMRLPNLVSAQVELPMQAAKQV